MRFASSSATLELALGIGKLEWAESNKPRKVDVLCESIAGAAWDFVS